MDELIGTNILDFFHHLLKKRSREVIFNKWFGTRLSRAVAVVERVQQEQFQECMNNGTLFSVDKSQCMDCTPE